MDENLACPKVLNIIQGDAVHSRILDETPRLSSGLKRCKEALS